jgi:eukaryotic-like serine/threonine-protein kinase
METAKTLPRGPIRVSDERLPRREEEDPPPRGDAERSPPRGNEERPPPRRDQLVLGRYRLHERLGAGGFGTVWRARDSQLGRSVALKRIPLPSPQERERAMREAHATARLSHPAIVSLYEACSDDDAFYLVSELIDGDTLAELIEQDALYDEEIVEIGLALTDALAHAHERGVVHRDVKPQNVLVPHAAAEHTPSRARALATAKLADFGGALLAGAEALTRTGDVFGTLAYMAPEQSDGHTAGPPADLYSLALVLYEALSGVNPVRGRTATATAKRIGAPIPPLRRARRDLPGELTRAIDAALQADPAHRGTLGDLHDALALTLERGLRPSLFARRAARDREHDRTRAGDEDRRAPRASAEPLRSPAASAALPAPAFEMPAAAGPPGLIAEPSSSPRTERLALPRTVWIGLALALALWQAIAGRPGVALLLLVATAPPLLLARRAGPGWLAAAAAPALGTLGLAAAFPALAGQRARASSRAGLAALGFWWLALAEPLLVKRLWLGPPAPPTGLPARSVWEASLTGTASHVLAAVATPQLALGALAWAAGAAVLPWIVRGRNAGLDVLFAIAWTVALLAAPPLIEQGTLAHAAAASPRGLLPGAMLGCALAICARALRGPVAPRAD